MVSPRAPQRTTSLAKAACWLALGLAGLPLRVAAEDLAASARAQGVVKVLVELRVSRLSQLTEASRSFKNQPLAPSERVAAAAADAALASAIATVSAGVLEELDRAAADYRVNHTYQSLPLLALDASERAVLALGSLSSVAAVTLDRAEPLPDPVIGKRGGKGGGPSNESGVLVPPTLDNTVRQIGADQAWARGYEGQGWYVAILDTGIRKSHAFFAGKSLVEHCFSSNSSCPNGQNEQSGTGSAAHQPSNVNGYDHGTHVAGIAAGGTTSLNGVARKAGVIAVQVFSLFTSESDCGQGAAPCVLSYNSDQLKGLDWVYQQRSTYNIGSINMSLGGGKYSNQALCDQQSALVKGAIDNLRGVNIPSAIASGNDGYCDGIGAPGCISSAIGVGAVTDQDVEAVFNNWYEPLMDVFAPGVDINSSIGSGDSAFGNKSGTSMATPHMAGAFTLLRQAYPTESVSQLFSRVTQAGVTVQTGCPNQSGTKPRVNIANVWPGSQPTATPVSATPTPTPRTCSDCTDADGDGVPTCWDKCGNTGSTSYVDKDGCPGSGGVPAMHRSWNVLAIALLSVAIYVVVATRRRRLGQKTGAGLLEW